MNVILKRLNVIFNVSKKAISFIKINTKNAFVAAVSFVKGMKEKITATSFFAKLQKFTSQNRLAVKITSYVLSITLVILLAATVTGARLGFNVEYNGKVIATVANEKVSHNALSAARKALSKDMTKFLSTPKLTLTITFDERLSSAEEMADSMISSTDEIVKTTALIINDEYKAFAENSELSSILNQRLNAFNATDVQCESQFVDKVETKEGYFLASDVENGADVSEIVSTLAVKTTLTKISKITIPYSTKEVNTSSKNVGYRKITTAGKNGIAEKSVKIELLNGKVLKQTLLSKVVVTEPVEQVVTVGTARKYISSGGNKVPSKSGFICPLAKGSFVISAYWGDGRNHKALDLAAPYGTSIYAAAGGKVVSAGWRNDYGYNIVIDHGNGIQTRYAHASRLFVSAGQRVDRGQVIAAVGSTGNSTGNHLHFEVILRGTRVNPAPYIGL